MVCHRTHVTLLCDHNKYILRLLGFLDTWINGECVQEECPLLSIDVLTLGVTQMSFQVEEPD